jgi:hypothetical protein
LIPGLFRSPYGLSGATGGSCSGDMNAIDDLKSLGLLQKRGDYAVLALDTCEVVGWMFGGIARVYACYSGCCLLGWSLTARLL